MSIESKNGLDDISWRLVQALQEDARLSYVELGRRVGLTSPAVAERLRRLEESGIITGYHADIDPIKIGLPITAYIRVPNIPVAEYPRFLAMAASWPEVVECYHMVGSDSFLMKVCAASLLRLEAITTHISAYSPPITNIVYSAAIPKRGVSRP